VSSPLVLAITDESLFLGDSTIDLLQDSTYETIILLNTSRSSEQIRLKFDEIENNSIVVADLSRLAAESLSSAICITSFL
jgi:hypothetical protein